MTEVQTGTEYTGRKANMTNALQLIQKRCEHWLKPGCEPFGGWQDEIRTILLICKGE